MENAFTFLPPDPAAAGRTPVRILKAQLPRAFFTCSAPHLCLCGYSRLSQAAMRKKTGALTAGRVLPGLCSPLQHHPLHILFLRKRHFSAALTPRTARTQATRAANELQQARAARCRFPVALRRRRGPPAGRGARPARPQPHPGAAAREDSALHEVCYDISFVRALSR